jgi:CheY-like chemotaxis protein
MCRGKILIAEDDLSQLAMFKHDFEDAGYTVLGFADGAEVYRMVEKYQPDLVVLDIMLPNVDGWVIARKLNTNPKTRHIPVVVVSGIDLEEAKDHILMHGCIDFLSKPVDTSAIIDRADRYVKLGAIKKRASNMLDKI